MYGSQNFQVNYFFIQDGKDQPNAEYTAAVGLENDVDLIESKYNSNIYDFVQKLPGITSKNIDTFLRKTKNMDNALTKTAVSINYYYSPCILILLVNILKCERWEKVMGNGGRYFDY